MNTRNVRYLAVATAFGFAAMSFTAQSSAGGLDLGGLVGGTLGSLGGTSGGTSGVSAKAAASIGSDAKAKGSIGGTVTAKTHVTLYKKKRKATAKLLIGKHGTYGKHGNLIKVTAAAGSKPLDAKAKILLGKSTKAKVTASLGHNSNVANVAGKAALNGVAKAKIAVNIGGSSPAGGDGPGGNNGTPPGTASSTPAAMAGSFRDLSMHDQYVLTRRCSAVLAAPARFDSDMVALCRIIATL